MAPEHSPTPRDTGQAALAGALTSSFRALRWVMIFVAAAYLFSGVFIVGQDERAYVLVFGKITGLGAERLKGPGLHWTWPKPIAEIIRIPTERVQAVESATFMPRENSPGETLQPGADGYTLTGDANLIHAKWAVRYTVVDLETYSFRLRDPSAILLRELDHAVVKGTARFPVDQALRTGIEALRGAVELELRQRVEALGLGLRIERVDVLALAPPKQVAAAFGAVIEAEQERSARIGEARASAARTWNEAQGEAARLVSEGEAYRRSVVAAVGAGADYFTKVHEQYQKNPGIVARTLLQDTLQRTLSNVEQKFLIHRNESGRQQLRLMLNPEPTPLHADP
jgi:membrane protease subunit HflK